uniref:Kinesin motor domain-containing protein n=1 Tax=Polytomella parva TaxID=51329 RepID=A0A7S0Y9G8_9CHLO|mmetsp:Transcript_16029/g.28788  ORF Transcript_16029/g.28788 Transcript_16029/m.28788 type:complete len:1231 (+) Transcript_16029:208-3900(+)|eukprot:CAMPEP_0175050840 /NCGR_PEP_ID=MMETSP0052_2-20121109/7471_1 /TAXON_ID=51329 ORGANISM="Polytomella parva, Strain SAG 63-3" /NCGR_SAMPLE_ID=MMETSP0052_2 /ASSEMBLY_ACC=CAM_ASM_000194 /LENGTH=1230 /DNA_ID=CAMNT_0016315065 /DNA_START=158 /DNA_END=3850 /DNA_ORIENTATION=+
MGEDYEPDGSNEEGSYAPRGCKLDGLSPDLFQLDAFFKAASKGGKGFSFFTRKKLKGTGTPGSTNSGGFTIEDLLLYSNEPIPTSLLKMSNEHMGRAVKMFGGILKFMGESTEPLNDAQRLEIAQKLLHQGLKRPELKDELFMQLVKQTRGNPNLESRAKAWELLYLVSSTMPPSKEFLTLVSEFIHAVAHDDVEEQMIKSLAAKTWSGLKRSAKAGPRRTLPQVEEIDAILSGRELSTIVFFLDETFEGLNYDVTTTVIEAVEQLAKVIKLQNYATFTLFECRKYSKQAQNGEPISDEHILLDDNKYIADILCEFRNAKISREGVQSRLLFKKRMFRETDETITEPQFINLSYVQAQHDYLQGNYPVVREDASQMCALQIQAEYASTLLDSEDTLLSCVELYITKQVLMTRPREEWKSDVLTRYRALEKFSKEDARLQFLRILRSLPYGNSIFFSVKRIEDPIGLLPAKLILGINKRGVHFFRPVPKEYLHSAELRDIMQFGSSSTAVFFKMRVAGVLHIFQFETRQGEDICMALQTHINDIMMKRYSKAKQMPDANKGSSSNANAHNQVGLSQPNFGPKYEQHVASLQQELEELKKKQDALARQEQELRYSNNGLKAELEDVKQALADESSQKQQLEETLASARAEVESLKTDLAIAKANAAAAAVASVGQQHQESTTAAAAKADRAQIAELEQLLEDRNKEVVDLQEKVTSLDKKAVQLLKEKELIEKKMQRIERAREAESAELRDKLEATQAEIRLQLRQKDDKISEIVDELASVSALYNDSRAEVEQMKNDQEELEELREMKADIERKEKQQAVIIENQARRLEELEKLYKDEQVLRKRYFNLMEDMKGKIRVFCRIRPLLTFEQDRGQQFGLMTPDEYTIAHLWKDEKKPREYNFDSVFTPDVTQDQVFEDTKHLVQSAVDGYNVCIFAYGQTGSGKTFTIYGNEKEPGLTPRGVNELFRIVNRDGGKYTFHLTVYMLELYQDSLADLLLSPQLKGSKDMPKLEVKKDPKGLVTVVGATLVEVTSAKELMAAIETGQQRRHVASTQMNRESSRSHLIISVIIESTNLQTQSVTKGKLSFVDLAGSERVKKSGSTGENLKEAQAINKSLSALGDVISALATEQQHIPYRNHKLTMLMSDSLGGNAKTLMFVNVSPSDNNIDETQNSLQYATRVRTIKNDASKNEANRDLIKLKKQIDYWKDQAGLPAGQRDIVDLLEISEQKDGN